MTGDGGLEFIEFAEGSTKIRLGGLNEKPKQFQPKMFQLGSLGQYIHHRPPNLRTSGPFCPSIKYNRRPGDETLVKSEAQVRK